MDRLSESRALKELKALILDRTGIFFHEWEEEILKYKLSRAMKAMGLSTFVELREQLSKQKVSLPDKVVASLTIGETYFFRSMPQIDLLKTYVLPKLYRRISQGQITTVWNPGCATGEETYTLAMLFLSHIPNMGKKLRIIGSDINKSFLEKAKKGIYDNHSIRVPTPPWARGYLIRKDDKYRVSDTIRNSVKFSPHNLKQEDSPAGTGISVIVCRHVLMYFDDNTQKTILNRFANLLDRSGFLVLGSSECLLKHDVFFSQMENDATIYQKRSEASEWTPRPQKLKQPTGSLGSEETPRHQKLKQPTRSLASEETPRHQILKQPTRSRETDILPSINDVQRLDEPPEEFDCAAWIDKAALAINAGDLLEASRVLNEIHRQVPTSAKAWLLHAQLSEQRGDDLVALEALHKVRFLEPELVLAYYLTASIEQRLNRVAEAKRHYTAALRMMKRLKAHEPIRWSDGLTKQMLKEHIETIILQLSYTNEREG